MLDKLEKFNGRLSDWFEWIGLAAMLLMMVTTCIDVVGAKIFRWRLFGAIDIVMLSQLVAIAFARSRLVCAPSRLWAFLQIRRRLSCFATDCTLHVRV